MAIVGLQTRLYAVALMFFGFVFLILAVVEGYQNRTEARSIDPDIPDNFRSWGLVCTIFGTYPGHLFRTVFNRQLCDPIITAFSGYLLRNSKQGVEAKGCWPIWADDLDSWWSRVFGCLTRLQTDYIDLYQIHWPDRYVPMFGETEYDPARQYCSNPIEDQLHALSKDIDAGKIRHIGLSNETPYGLMKFLQEADRVKGHPMIVSLQNSYSFPCRTFDSALAECCHHKSICLWSEPISLGNQKCMRSGELRRALVFPLSSASEDHMFRLFNFKPSAPVAIADLKNYQDVLNASLKAMEISFFFFQNSIFKLDNYMEIVGSKKRQRSPLSNERPGGASVLKTAEQPSRYLIDQSTQKLED